MSEVKLEHIEAVALEIVDASRDRDITREEAERDIRRLLNLAYRMGNYDGFNDALHKFRRL